MALSSNSHATTDPLSSGNHGKWRTVPDLMAERRKLGAGDAGATLHPLVVHRVEDAYVACFGDADFHVPVSVGNKDLSDGQGGHAGGDAHPHRRVCRSQVPDARGATTKSFDQV